MTKINPNKKAKFSDEYVTPDQTVYFNSIATYSHSKHVITVTPNVSIGYPSSGAYIAIETEEAQDIFTASIPTDIKYTPN